MPQQVTDESQQKAWPSFPEVDWFLQSLVDAANGCDRTVIGITLQVGGFLVSGMLASGRMYFEELGADYASTVSEETAEMVRETFAKCGEIYKSTDDENPDLPQPTYVHLKEARLFNAAGKPIPENHGVWWRGRLSEVSGFCLGILSTES